MKRSIVVGLFCTTVGFAAGYVMNPRPVAAQNPASNAERAGGMLFDHPTEARLQDGKAFVIARDKVVKDFPAADKTGKVAPTTLNTTMGWDPVYSLVVMRRPYMDPPIKSANTGQMTHWADAEMHEEKAQLYIIMSGTGQVTLGGKAPMEHHPIMNGQHGGGPLGKEQGATAEKVKPGDIVVIPPFTWHQSQADPGQTLTYMKVDILQPRLEP
jgi:mannose-6-phosphate isomerase-like protein (cupin superfamily)